MIHLWQKFAKSLTEISKINAYSILLHLLLFFYFMTPSPKRHIQRHYSLCWNSENVYHTEEISRSEWFDCLLFYIPLENLHSYADVTIAGEWRQSLDLHLVPIKGPLGREGSVSSFVTSYKLSLPWVIFTTGTGYSETIVIQIPTGEKDEGIITYLHIICSYQEWHEAPCICDCSFRGVP
jgi:hypothetical protein